MSLKVAPEATGGWGVTNTNSFVFANENGAQTPTCGLVVVRDYQDAR